jgi:VanZ family protein
VSFIEDYEGGRLVKAAFWAAAAFTLVMALTPGVPDVSVNNIDKVEHAAAFATLGILGTLAFRRLSGLSLIVILSLLGALIELAQATSIVHRDCDPLDWVADTVACALVVVILRWWKTRPIRNRRH